MIPDRRLNIWEHSRGLRKLCLRRGLDEEPEMEAAAQGAELMVPYIVRPGLRLLDVGCAGGHFFHSLRRRNLEVDYLGLDSSPAMVSVARRALGKSGLPGSSIILGCLEDLVGVPCDLAVMINTLTFSADFRAPLERLVETGTRVILIRDNFGPKTRIKWETDGYLDEGFNHLHSYWNRWSVKDVGSFLGSCGFDVTAIKDRRCQGRREMVVDKPYYWSWLLATKS